MLVREVGTSAIGVYTCRLVQMGVSGVMIFWGYSERVVGNSGAKSVCESAVTVPTVRSLERIRRSGRGRERDSRESRGGMQESGQELRRRRVESVMATVSEN